MPPNSPRPDKPAPSPIELIAAGAHELWCQRMIQEGWSYSPVFNPEAKRHDALVPFRDLDIEDQATTCGRIEAEGLDQDLIEVIEYHRGPDRPLMLAELRVGMRVEFISEPCNEQLADEQPADDQTDEAEEDHTDAAPNFGRVISWSLSPRTGRLELVRVRWDDGTESEHCPWEQDLRRATEMEDGGPIRLDLQNHSGPPLPSPPPPPPPPPTPPPATVA